ncbi:MAG TPA: hypothetical protein VKV21_17315 [Solirubrobacteraceae bacterium]|nr:hypothetical protein [Solirubrobacteraceae bacterium]
MSITRVVEPVPVNDQTGGGNPRWGLWHTSSEADPGKGLCGARLNGEVRDDIPNGDPDSCVVCDDLYACGVR